MKKIGLYLLLILAISACKSGGNNNAETTGNATQPVTQSDTLQVSHGPVLLPVDEAAKDSSFLNFRKRFLKAISNKDEIFLLSVLDKNIKIGFGGDDGISNFKKQWQANNYEHLWPVMQIILENGGAFMPDDEDGKKSETVVFMAPYVYSNWPDSLDAFSYLAVINKNAAIYKESQSKITNLSYEIVKGNFFDSDKSKFGLLYIETLDNKIKGYMQADNLYSPVAYRAIFSKQKDKWKLQALVSGD